MSNGTILVTGATGNTGSGVAQALLSQGQPVRALVRDEGKASELKSAGAEIVVADLDRPETLSNGVFGGISKVYLAAAATPNSTKQISNFLGAAQSSGASPHIVRLAAFGTPDCRLIKDHQVSETDVQNSRLPWTILAPTFFMQNILFSAQTIKDQGAIYYDWGDGKAGMIDSRDIVDSAVGVLTSNGSEYHGERITLTGPASIGFADVAEILSRVLGKEVSYVPVPHEAALEAMKGMGLDEWIAEAYVELSVGFKAGYADTTTDGVERLAGHPARDFETFANDFKAAFS